MPKQKYLLKKKQGKHVEDDVMYAPGDVIESNRPLDKLFPNRFQKLEGAKAKKAEPAEGVPLNDPVLTHPQDEPHTRDANDEDENEDEDEDEEEEPRQAPNVEESKKEIESSKGDDEDTKALTMEQGKDLTEKFADAKKAGFKVFKNADGFNVVDEADLTKIVNKKPLASKTEVNAFLKDYV